MTTTLHDLPTLIQSGALGQAPDHALLERFRARRDDAAFAALIERHGPMVWGVCRRVAGDHHEAEEAFQETFVVLVRRAGSLAGAETVAPWLFGVAHRVARKRRMTLARRRSRERPATAEPATSAPRSPDLAAILDGELAALPARYRAAVVLCDLQGLTRREAAAQLGWAEGTVASRLARGRARLAERLRRRGLTPESVLLLPAAGPVSVALDAATKAAVASRVGPGSLSLGLLGWVASGVARLRVEPVASMVAIGTLTAGLIPLGPVGVPPTPPASVAQDSPPTNPPPAPAAPTRQDLATVVDKASRIFRDTASLRQRSWFWLKVLEFEQIAGREDARREDLDRLVAELPKLKPQDRLWSIKILASQDRIIEAMHYVSHYARSGDRDWDVDASHGLLAMGLAQAGEVAWARRFASIVSAQSPHRDDLARTLVDLHLKRGEIKSAIGFAAIATRPFAKSECLIKIAAAQIKAGDLDGAAASLDAASRIADPADRKSPSGDILPMYVGQIAGLLEQLGKGEEARAKLKSLTDPRSLDYAWREIARGQISRGRLPEARETIALIRGENIQSEARADLAKALAQSGDLVAARQQADSIKDDPARVEALAGLAVEQARKGQVTEATATIAEARKVAERVVPDPGPSASRAAVFEAVGRAQAALPDRSADGWIDTLADPIQRMDALIGLADGLSKQITPAPSVPPSK